VFHFNCSKAWVSQIAVSYCSDARSRYRLVDNVNIFFGKYTLQFGSGDGLGLGN